MKNQKGEVDLITLVVGMIPMILFIILSGYLLVENPIQTDLGTQISFEESRFESLMALSHVLVYNDTMERINRYSEFPDDSDDIKTIIESDINDSTSYIADTTEDGASDTSTSTRGRSTATRGSRSGTTGSSTTRSSRRGSTDRSTTNTLSDLSNRRFMMNVTMPEEDNISVSTPNTNGAFVSSELNIASPKTDPITIEVILDRN